MTHVTCRLTAKNRDQLRNPTLGNRVWASFTFTFFCQHERLLYKRSRMARVCTINAASRCLADLCVRRRLRTVVASLALQSPGLSWCPGLRRLLASAALLRMAAGPGTDYQRLCDHQNCRCLHSSASSRPTCLFQH